MRSYLKSILPHSLFGRAALILIAPIIAIQLIVSVVFIQRHFEGVTRQMAQGVAIEIRLLLQVIEGSDSPIKANDELQFLAKRLELDVDFPVPDGIAGDSYGFWDLSGQEVIASLRKEIPAILGVDLRTNWREVRLVVATKLGPVAIKIDRNRISASNPHQLLVLMVVASILMTLIAYVFLRNQLTPITRLAEAADAFGKGQTLSYHPRGATEVRAAGKAFLDMRRRIDSQIEQRTLLLSGVSHDLRTPLTRLRLGMSMLPADADSEAMTKDVIHMQRLVDEFLAFARGDAMETAQNIDPAELVRLCVGHAHRAGQPVSVGRLDGPAEVSIRSQAVQRAIENLIGNAQRHGTKVVVSLASNDKMLSFVVEDNGPGIPAERRAEAMMPFARLDSARDPNLGGGVGLGLSIASDIAHSHGGMLRLSQSQALGGLCAELFIAK